MRTKNELYQQALRTVAMRRQTARALAQDAQAEAEAADILAPYQPCFITSVPDEKWGEKVVLAVLRAVPESLLHGLRARLGSVRAPKEIRVIDRIPLSPSGKPLRPKLPK